MINAKFVWLGAALNFAGLIGYLLAVFAGRARPNRVTWILWATAPLIGFVIQIQEGVGLAAVMTFMVGFGPLMVVIASFISRSASWKIVPRDYFCGVLSVIAFVFWLAFHQAGAALALLILSDFLAALPTIHKSWRHPESESAAAFLGGLGSSFITLLTLDSFGITNAGFALYIFVINAFFVTIIVTGHRGLRPGSVAVSMDFE